LLEPYKQERWHLSPVDSKLSSCMESLDCLMIVKMNVVLSLFLYTVCKYYTMGIYEYIMWLHHYIHVQSTHQYIMSIFHYTTCIYYMYYTTDRCFIWSANIIISCASVIILMGLHLPGYISLCTVRGNSGKTQSKLYHILLSWLYIKTILHNIVLFWLYIRMVQYNIFVIEHHNFIMKDWHHVRTHWHNIL
jgi:hypothetical protein